MSGTHKINAVRECKFIENDFHWKLFRCRRLMPLIKNDEEEKWSRHGKLTIKITGKKAVIQDIKQVFKKQKTLPTLKQNFSAK